MSPASQDDSKTATASTPLKLRPMTAFVESCVETIADSAHQVERRAKGRPRAKHLLSGVNIDVSIKGNIVGGMNAAFAKQADLQLIEWTDDIIAKHDAVILV